MTKETPDVIEQLSASEARSILKALIREDRQLAIRIREMSLSCLADVDTEEIAAATHDELKALEVEEVWDRAGPSHRHGYVDPSEAADEMIQEVLNPFLFELEKYQRLGMNAQANQVCMGLLLGLYRFEHESGNEFKAWAIDAAGEWAGEVLSTWKKGQPSRSDIQEIKSFIDQEMAHWAGLLI